MKIEDIKKRPVAASETTFCNKRDMAIYIYEKDNGVYTKNMFQLNNMIFPKFFICKSTLLSYCLF